MATWSRSGLRNECPRDEESSNTRNHTEKKKTCHPAEKNILILAKSRGASMSFLGQNKTHLIRPRGSGRFRCCCYRLSPGHTDSNQCPMGQTEIMGESVFHYVYVRIILSLFALKLESHRDDVQTRLSCSNCLLRARHEPRAFHPSRFMIYYVHAAHAIYTTAGDENKSIPYTVHAEPSMNAPSLSYGSGRACSCPHFNSGSHEYVYML